MITSAAVVVTLMSPRPLVASFIAVVVAVVTVTVRVSASVVAIVTGVGAVVRLLVPPDVIVDDVMVGAVLVCGHVVLVL